MQLASKEAADAANTMSKVRNGHDPSVIIPHPITTQMQRHTFLCTTCNQTKTYVLRAK